LEKKAQQRGGLNSGARLAKMMSLEVHFLIIEEEDES
jgi:hypothetical protein